MKNRREKNRAGKKKTGQKCLYKEVAQYREVEKQRETSQEILKLQVKYSCHILILTWAGNLKMLSCL